MTADIDVDVRVDSAAGGMVGLWNGAIAEFKGIPFAAPPVGDRRWRPPAPAARWDGDRRAYDFAPAPLQPQPPRDSVMFHTNFDDRRSLTMSEDCLYLNVWTADPSSSAGLPVMVWIHGGGNRYGYGSQDIHNGRAMAARGVVVVTLNYRLGALGFLAHPELAAEDELGAAGNYGLLDIVGALEWVRDNIAGFGGDPARVTVAGNSAGAAHVTHLMAAPAARNLFRAAIGQSAAGIHRAEGPMPTAAAAAADGVRYAEQFGGRDLIALRRLAGVEFVLTGHFGPIVDGRFIVRDSQTVFTAGDQAAVPLLVGSNADEGANYTTPGAVVELMSRSTQLGDEFARAYPTSDDLTAKRSARLFVGESRFGYPIWRWAKTHHNTSGAPTWLYRLDHEPPLPYGPDLAPPPDGMPGYGVFHTAELAYTADNLATRAWAWTDTDRCLAKTMADAWARFVTDLDPNGPGLPGWPAFDGTDEGQLIVFGADIAPAAVPRLSALTLLDRLPRPL